MPITIASAGATTPGSNVGGLSASLGYTTTANLAPGSITHVWLIILENKSYNSEFSGVNDDTYLWQTLPSEGALLENYHGTGHTSMDNYITLASGQAPQYDVQSDCSDVNSQFSSDNAIPAGATGGIVTTGSPVGGDTNWTYGQAVSNFGPDHVIQNNATTTNGCTYPSDVPTLFDQFNQAGITWKGYAQDLGGAQLVGSTSFQSNTVPGRDDLSNCGAPGNPDQSQANPVSNPTYLSGSGGYPIGANLVSSKATSGTTTSLTDVLQNWSSGEWNGDELIITGGTGKGEYGTVTATSANTVTLTLKALPTSSVVAPDSTSTYVIGPIDTSTYTAASVETGTGTNPFTGTTYADSASTYNPEYVDQYVAKHFPFPWFESLTGVGGSALTEPANGGTNCDSNHIANLDSPTDGLVSDLQSNTVPNFSWITPNNCSDGHDSECKGNNLSGAFGLNPDHTIDLDDPIYSPSSTAGANCTLTVGATQSGGNCSGIPSDDPEATTPRNFTGGTYAADLFLAYYVPLIEHSSAFAHGLIDVTFDEGEPSFVYGGNTFNNIPTSGPTSTGADAGLNLPAQGTGTTGPSGVGAEDSAPVSPSGVTGTPAPMSYPVPPAVNPDESLSYGPGTANPGADSQFAADDLYGDSAGESFDNSGTVTSVNSEPTGPNSPLATDTNGYQLFYGPGFNLDINRPPVCPAGEPDGYNNTNCVAGEVLGDGGTTSASTRTDTVTNSASSDVVTDGSIAADDTGREIVAATVNGTAVAAGTTAYDDAFQVSGGPLPTGDAVYIGEVTQNGPAAPTSNAGGTTSLTPAVDEFQLIDDNGNAITPASGTVTNVTLSGECDPAAASPTSGTNLPSTCTGNLTPDPLFDALDPTPGGGDTGSVLISPYITPGTVSSVSYNHYDWLRTMEDLLDVSSCKGTASDVTLPAGTVCGGLDGDGHLGYAAQTNLNDFGADVFTAPSGDGFGPTNPGSVVPEAPLTVALPLLMLMAIGAVLVVRRRRSQRVSA